MCVAPALNHIMQFACLAGKATGFAMKFWKSPHDEQQTVARSSFLAGTHLSIQHNYTRATYQCFASIATNTTNSLVLPSHIMTNPRGPDMENILTSGPKVPALGYVDP